jgi:CheY-like chemotaxis protein
MLPADTLVVLVDDDHAILHGMAELFDSWDIDLVAAPNAEDILHWLAGLARAPDVIVSDYRLPGDNDGLEVIAQLRRHFGRDIPAIVITGDTASDTIQRIGQAGFPILNKPLQPAKLRALLSHLLQQSPTPPVG